MYFKSATIAYFALLLSTTSAQPYTPIHARSPDAKVDAGKIAKRLGGTSKPAVQAGCKGFSKRDLGGLYELAARDPKVNVGGIFKDMAQGVGTVQGAGVKALLGREALDDDELQLLSGGGFQRPAGSAGHREGHGHGPHRKTRRCRLFTWTTRDAFDLYARDAEADPDAFLDGQCFDMHAREAEAGGKFNTVAPELVRARSGDH
ncbi:MAG: hypothetical protein LQ340_007637 [Diploschistes diacapsis]|nr:MAG: hypothetical protein LQ340_007637 [Diploschistes diacapsis]